MRLNKCAWKSQPTSWQDIEGNSIELFYTSESNNPLEHARRSQFEKRVYSTYICCKVTICSGQVPQEYVEGFLHNLIWPHIFAGGEKEPGCHSHWQDEPYKHEECKDNGPIFAFCRQRNGYSHVHSLFPIRMPKSLPILSSFLVCSRQSTLPADVDLLYSFSRGNCFKLDCDVSSYAFRLET